MCCCCFCSRYNKRLTSSAVAVGAGGGGGSGKLKTDCSGSDKYTSTCLLCSPDKCVVCPLSARFAEDKYLNADKCELQACSTKYGAQCAKCNQSTCTECIYGYGANASGGCESCSSKVDANCLDCNNTSTCIKCKTGYAVNPSTGKCVACSTLVGHSKCLECLIQNGNPVCTKCDNLFGVDSTGSCSLCSSVSQSCRKCPYGVNKCTECISPYTPMNGTCGRCIKATGDNSCYYEYDTANPQWLSPCDSSWSCTSLNTPAITLANGELNYIQIGNETSCKNFAKYAVSDIGFTGNNVLTPDFIANNGITVNWLNKNSSSTVCKGKKILAIPATVSYGGSSGTCKVVCKYPGIKTRAVCLNSSSRAEVAESNCGNGAAYSCDPYGTFTYCYGQVLTADFDNCVTESICTGGSTGNLSVASAHVYVLSASYYDKSGCNYSDQAPVGYYCGRPAVQYDQARCISDGCKWVTPGCNITGESGTLTLPSCPSNDGNFWVEGRALGISSKWEWCYDGVGSMQYVARKCKVTPVQYK